ncbi:LOW QUALITY PROTEIN: hypothetical protein Cgig2_032951 [Carnegiea gigantea]|uniref:Uncharacterized protein n=1 Tax=Carnegiea gigantea TaxID=171969 RepID=A0A9Q1GME0_9CARY|nr:LOW QUALITY PROTEIN: hypothetical protein Cgig2_032951 [Carnegiea gigantea]
MKWFPPPPTAVGPVPTAVWPVPTAQPSWFCPWCPSCFSWLHWFPPSEQSSLPVQAPIGRHHFRCAGKVRPSRASSRRASMPNREPIAETLGNNSKVFSIFVDNLPNDLSITSFKNLFVLERFWMHTFQTMLEENPVENIILSDLLTFKRVEKLLIS